ncbi:MAG: DUF2231 domain-containing protein [Gemmatimonadota bacterium]|nr:DUF2231 domain-containing protein [Gemmatimonadota bacterium]
MPDIAALHPIIVHFVVALGIVGVIFRLIALTGKLSWTGPAATALILIAAGASVAAAESGDQAHEWAERIPGAGEAVQEHEELGEKTRNLFLIVAALEIAALAFRTRAPLVKGLRVAAGVGGVVACYFLYEAGEHGGELVYSYAGGVGTRTGDVADVRRLLIAGLYHQARVARDSGQAEEAARLTEEMHRQAPQDFSVALLGVQSLLTDRKDPLGALTALSSLSPPADDARANVRVGLLRSEVFVALSQPDSARAVLIALSQKYPESRWVAEALKKLAGGS